MVDSSTRYPPEAYTFILEKVDTIRCCVDKISHRKGNSKVATAEFVIEEVVSNGRYCTECRAAILAAWDLVKQFSEFIKGVVGNYASKLGCMRYFDDLLMDAHLACFMSSFTFDPGTDAVRRLLNYYGVAIRHYLIRKSLEYKSVRVPLAAFRHVRKKVLHEGELDAYDLKVINTITDKTLQIWDFSTLDDLDDETQQFIYLREEQTPEQIVIADELNQKIRDLVTACLDTLTERERYVLVHRFGLDGHPQTLQEVGRALGVSRERVRQIEVAAIRKIRRRLVVSGQYRLLKQIFFDS